MSDKINRFFSFKIAKSILFGTIFWLILAGFFYFYVGNLQNPNPSTLTTLDNARFANIAQTTFPRTKVLPLPWSPNSAGIDTQLSINAESSILIDSNSGSILFEKNADTIIPPASMTKLVAMYVVFQEIETGRISLDDIVPFSPEAWAINAPPYSSLMFLSEGHIVTLKELLLGLAIPSGNDSAVAVADYVSGSMEAFIGQMNSEMEKLGLTQTHFVDSSGYHELNLTTAREFAIFSQMYVQKYPESLEMFHSVPQIAYPQEYNLPTWRKGKDNPIVQKNTNPALGVIEGVTGLKTGFIPESGYNLSLTAERNGTEILSITMGGPGVGGNQGNKYRLEDAQTLVEYAFANFKTVQGESSVQLAFSVLGGSENALYGREAWSEAITVPSTALSLTRTIDIPPFLQAPVVQGDIVGTVVYSVDGFVVQEVPLLADRNITQAGNIKSAIDALAGALLGKQ